MKSVLRWLLVLPVAVGSYYFVKLIGNLVLPFSDMIVGKDSWPLVQLIYVGLASWASIWFGAVIAPSRNFVVAVVLVVLAAIGAVLNIAVTFTEEITHDSWWVLLCNLVGVGAAVGAAWKIRSKANESSA